MTVLTLHSEPLREEWLDAYGHLNEAYYLVPFSNATWILQEHFNIGVPYFEETGCAIYTVETHLRYLKEVRHPATMDIESMILGVEQKKIWFAHRMMVDGVECASGEFMTLHYDTRRQRVTQMPETVRAHLRSVRIEPLPDWVGRRIRPIPG
ncbi:MAG: thioesterase [Gammaproteobacteria bacterium]|nr:thioesterase [Gammaproteobacteria bacterium]MYD75917.1 thioesterase [Gammaproteobacteria bacterium]MYJ52331.1 thioesterase [Gammaproteobacteria bacterium]